MLGILGWASIAAGALLLVLVALIMSPSTDEVEESMRYEALVAVGFGAILVGGPLWLVQGVTGVIAGILADSGRVWLELGGWFLLAPLVAVSPPARALARRFARP